MSTPQSPAPVARREALAREFHGHVFIDEYEWLRDKEAPETRDYLEAENAYTRQQTAQLQQLEENLFQELKSRVKETDMSVPVRMGGYWYYSRSEEGKSYGYSCRLAAEDAADPWIAPEIVDGEIPAAEELLLDLNELAQGHDYFSLGAHAVSESGQLLAYSTDTAGDERYDLVIKDLSTGELLADRIPGISAGATWVGDDYLFYVRVDASWRAYQVWRHRVGTDVHDDVLIFQEDDEMYSVGVGLSRSKQWLMIVAGSSNTTEYRVVSAAEPADAPVLLWPRETGVEYSVDHVIIAGTDYWMVTHNWEAVNFQIGLCPVASAAQSLPPLAQLEVVIGHDDQVRIEDTDAYADFVVVDLRRDGMTQVGVMDISDSGLGPLKLIDFSEEVFSVGATGNPEFHSPNIRLSYTSLTQPAQLISYEVATDKRTLLKEQEVRGEFSPEDYISSRHWVTAADGARIPVSVVHRADLDTSVPQPLHLYGYGSYELSMDPSFSTLRLSLLDRGMIYAIAHVRGGGEMGRPWYDDGKLLKKKNTFTDFIAVADYLIDNKITSPDKLVASGGSAGGLLIGAVANMAPDRFAALSAQVPFVDPLTSILKPELPLTIGEWNEWGDPYHDPEFYEYIRSYAPYENISAQKYPNILAGTSFNDTRVLYVEPAKWIAKLRATATGGEFLLKTEMSAGHGGVSGRYESWRQAAFEYAWLINQATGLVR